MLTSPLSGTWNEGLSPGVCTRERPYNWYAISYQEAILFAIRHGLALRGWSMLGKSSGVRVGALFIKALDLSQAKNSVDAFKVWPPFTRPQRQTWKVIVEFNCCQLLRVEEGGEEKIARLLWKIDSKKAAGVAIRDTFFMAVSACAFLSHSPRVTARSGLHGSHRGRQAPR
jgi:hypothetical protein